MSLQPGSPERAIALERVEKSIKDTLSGVAVVTRLPGQVHFVVYDQEMGKSFSGITTVSYGEGGMATFTDTEWGGPIRSDRELVDFADFVARKWPGMELVCNEAAAAKMNLRGRERYELNLPNGRLVVHVPQPSFPIHASEMPPGSLPAGAKVQGFLRQ